MRRRTVSLPDAIDDIVRESAREGESFSATVSRLVEAGARALHATSPPDWIGSGEGPSDLGRRAEEYLRRPVPSRR